MSKYFFTDGKEKYGPFSKSELKNQKITRSTKVWFFGLGTWTELSKIPELNDIIASIPPEIKSRTTLEKPKEKKESKKKAGIKILPPQKKKRVKMKKWLIGILIMTLVSFLIYFSIKNQAEVNLYNKVVENSYDSDEDFQVYVDKFYRDLEYFGIYAQKPKTTIIKFSKLDQMGNTTHIHGLSFGSHDNAKIEIYINPSSWRQFNKPMRYFLMYHELAHDILNLDDLDPKSFYEGKLMYPEISSYESKNMDDFIESAHALFEEQTIE
ncbi:DUF4339 domain-containing protein [Xanthovirga aplysinae]|uniref:DUF4339 domain-containing protein n=1 Tax=Xanthovirga aplysinae TaxID=2529853 RepID=UPI0012BBC62C|nr:DUF4339 domain-containing protein [Xanthovirga aplysinae]MTI29764.1 DUF4339 domain-containing protein [Xanthovirga aplysinae]